MQFEDVKQVGIVFYKFDRFEPFDGSPPRRKGTPDGPVVAQRKLNRKSLQNPGFKHHLLQGSYCEDETRNPARKPPGMNKKPCQIVG